MRVAAVKLGRRGGTEDAGRGKGAGLGISGGATCMPFWVERRERRRLAALPSSAAGAPAIGGGNEGAPGVEPMGADGGPLGDE